MPYRRTNRYQLRIAARQRAMREGKARARMEREMPPRWSPPDLRRRLIVEDYDTGTVKRTVFDMYRDPRVDTYRVAIDGKAQPGRLGWSRILDRVRQVPLSPRAREILAALPRTDAPVFNLHPGTRDSLWRRAVKAAEIADLHFHDSRAEAIWRLSRVFNVMELARIIGHRNINSLLLYYAVRADELADRLE